MEISLIIPTYNRPHFLGRLLRYYRKLKFPHLIVVADSSPTPACVMNQEFIAPYSNDLNIHYKLFSPDTLPNTKIPQMLGKVASEYAVICADDDFIVPNAIEQCVRYLQANPDYSVVRGRSALINCQSSTYRDSPYGLVTGAGPYTQRTIDFDDVRLRLPNHLMNYTTTFYSVHRRSDLIQNLCVTGDLTHFDELLPSCLSLIQGKVKCLDVLYTVRQAAHKPEYPGSDLYDWLINPDWLSSYQIFRDRLVEELVHQDEITTEKAQEIVKQAFWAYLSKGLSKKWQGRYAPPQGPIHILRSKARNIPVVRKIWQELRSRKPGRESKFTLPALLRPSSPYYADFMPIYQVITTPPPEFSNENK